MKNKKVGTEVEKTQNPEKAMETKLPRTEKENGKGEDMKTAQIEETVNAQASKTDEPVTEKEEEPAQAQEANRTPEEEGQEMEPLPDGVTSEPRNEEELHLDLVRKSKYMLETYLGVSDDNEDLHGDLELERQVRELGQQHSSIDGLSEEELNRLLTNVKSLLEGYVPKVNIAEATTSGRISKYRIREGMLLNLEQSITTKLNLKWTQHLKESHPGISLRSAQVYMSVAKIPRATAYAFLGLDRLIPLERAVKEINPGNSPDPLKDYLERYGLVLDPTNPDREQLDKIRDQIDTLIIMDRIKKVEKKSNLTLNVDEGKILEIVKLGKKVDQSRIDNLVLISKNGGDPNKYLEDIYKKKKKEPDLVVSEGKVQSIPKLASTLKETVEYLEEHTDVISRIDSAHIQNIEDHLTKLKTLVSSN